MRFIDIDRILNWVAAFCVGYVIGVGVAACVVFYWRA